MWHNVFLATIWRKYIWVNEQPGSLNSSWISRLFLLLGTFLSVVLGVLLFTQDNTYADAEFRSISKHSPIRLKDIVLCPAAFGDIKVDCRSDSVCPSLERSMVKVDTDYKYLAFYNSDMIDFLGVSISEIDQLAGAIRAQTPLQLRNEAQHLKNTAALTKANASDLLLPPKVLQIVKKCVSEGDCEKEHLWMAITHSAVYNGSFVDRAISDTTGRHITPGCRFMDDIPCYEAVRAIWVENRHCMAWLWDSYPFLSSSQYHEFTFLSSNFGGHRYFVSVWRGHVSFDKIELKDFLKPVLVYDQKYQLRQMSGIEYYSVTWVRNQTEGRLTVCQPDTTLFVNFSTCVPSEEKSFWLHQDSSYDLIDPQHFQYSGSIQRSQVLTLTTIPIYSQLERFELLGGLVGITQGFTGWQAIILLGVLLFDRQQTMSMALKVCKYSFYTLCVVATFALIGTLLVFDLNRYEDESLINTFSIINSNSVPTPHVVLKPSFYGAQWINTTKLYEHNVSLPLLQYMFVAASVQYYYPGYSFVRLRNEKTNLRDDSWKSDPRSEEFQYVNALTRVETLHLLPQLEQEYKDLARKLNMNPDDPAQELLLSFFLDPCQIVKECSLSGKVISNCCGRTRYVLWGNSGNVIALRLTNALLEPHQQTFDGAGPEKSLKIKVDIKPFLEHADIREKYVGPKFRHRAVDTSNCGERCKDDSYKLNVYLENPAYENPRGYALASYEKGHMYDWDEVWPGKRLKFKLDVMYGRFVDSADYRCYSDASNVCGQYSEWMYSLRNLVILKKCGCVVCIKELGHIALMNDTCCTPAAAVRCLVHPSMFTMWGGRNSAPNAYPTNFMMENWSSGNIESGMTTPGTTNVSTYVTYDDMAAINCTKHIPACDRFVFTAASTEVVDNPTDMKHWVIEIFLGTDQVKANIQNIREFRIIEFVGILLCGVGFMFGFSLPAFVAAIVSLVLRWIVKISLPPASQDADEASSSIETATAVQDQWDQIVNPMIEHWQRYMVSNPKESATVQPLPAIDDRVEEMELEETGSVGNPVDPSVSASVAQDTNVVVTKKATLPMAAVSKQEYFARLKQREQLKASVMGLLLIVLAAIGLAIAVIMLIEQLDAVEFDQKPLLNTKKMPMPSVAICGPSEKLSQNAMKSLIANSICSRRDLTGFIGAATSCDNSFSILFTSENQNCALMDNSRLFAAAKQQETVIRMEIDNQSPIDTLWMGDTRDLTLARFGTNFDWKANANVDVEYNAESWRLRDGSCDNVLETTPCIKCDDSMDNALCCFGTGASDEVYDYARTGDRPPCDRVFYGYDVCVPGRLYGVRQSCPAPTEGASRRYLRIGLQTNVMYEMVKSKRHSAVFQLCLAGGYVDLFFGVSIMSAVYGVVFLCYYIVKKISTRPIEA